MAITENVHILVVGKRSKKVKQVKDSLTRYFSRVTLVSTLADIENSCDSNYLTLIVVTDAIRDKEKNKLNKEFLINLRTLYPYAKVLCLFDSITHDVEINLRSGGLIFLGSYERFYELSPAILYSASGSVGKKSD